MGVPDFTDLILKSSIWFLVGALLYYVLSFMKVHLIWEIQGRVWIPEYEKNIFVGVKKSSFMSFFSRGDLHKGTFKYLFSFKEEDFEIFNHWFHGRLTKRVDSLNSLTFFFKSFIICGAAFTILRFWIVSEFLYDELTILAKEIDLLLDTLNSYSIFATLKEYKVWIYFSFALSLIFVPNYLISKLAKDKVKNNVFFYLNVFLVVLNISFFGISIGEETSSITDKLEKHKSEVLNLYYAATQDIAAEVLAVELADVLKKQEVEFTKEYYRFKKKVDARKYIYLADKNIQLELESTLNNQLKLISILKTKIENFKFNHREVSKKHQKRHGTKPDFFDDFVKNRNQESQRNQKKRYDFSNSEDWNLKKGHELNEFKKTLIRSSPKNKYFSSVKSVVKVLLQYGLGAIISGGFDNDKIGLESQNTLKKIVSIWANTKLQEYCRSKFEKLFPLMNSEKKAVYELNENQFDFSDENYSEFRRENDRFFRDNVSSAEKKSALNTKIRSQEIIKSFKVYDLQLKRTLDEIVLEWNSKAINESKLINESEKSKILSNYKQTILNRSNSVNELKINLKNSRFLRLEVESFVLATCGC